MRLDPLAAYDSLFIARRLRSAVGNLALAGNHRFAYPACLLWLYRSSAYVDWGYEFVATELGAPFSLRVDESIGHLVDRGFLIRNGHRIEISPLAEQALEEFAHMGINHERTECLEAACASTSAFSIGMVSSAVASEPDLNRAQFPRTSRRLLGDSTRSNLYVQFDALRQSVGHRSHDLRLPAIIWLTALYRSNEPASAHS